MLQHSQFLKNSMTSVRQVCVLCILLSATLLVGCGGDPGPTGPERIDTYPVTGKVTVNGEVVQKPKLIAVKAILEGTEGSDLQGAPDAFVSDEDGSFSLGSYDKGDGVPPGTYKLTFRLGGYNMMTARFAGDEFEGKYNDPKTSEHTVTVTGDGAVDIETIDLTL